MGTTSRAKSWIAQHRRVSIGQGKSALSILARLETCADIGEVVALLH